MSEKQYIEIGPAGVRPCDRRRFANGSRAEDTCTCDWLRMTRETIAVDERIDHLRRLRDLQAKLAKKSAAA